MHAAEIYAARIEAVRVQRARLPGAPSLDDLWGGGVAQRFRFDPHRPLDANLTRLASSLHPDDVFLDVGGGAGRVALPLALRCREVIYVGFSRLKKKTMPQKLLWNKGKSVGHNAPFR